MSTNLKDSYDDNWQPKCLPYFSAALVAIYLTTNVIAAKQALLFGITVTAGTVLFPFLLVLGDIMSEVYGYPRSKKVIIAGFLAMFFFTVITQLALALPSSPNWDGQPAFEKVLKVVPRIACASLINYLITDLANALVISKMKRMQGSKGFPVRAVASTVIAQALDSVVFYPLAFIGIIPFPVLVQIIISSWCIKVMLEVAALPLTIYLVRIVKQLEGIEHFDGKPVVAPLESDKN
jgi:uncharacterized integral membrane protein (TIGR00697 family)